MTKKELIQALDGIVDNDHIMIGEHSFSYVPKISVVCGKSKNYTCYSCILPVGHDGECYSSIKNVYFLPDD
jgi:hypothetical protein